MPTLSLIVELLGQSAQNVSVEEEKFTSSDGGWVQHLECKLIPKHFVIPSDGCDFMGYSKIKINLKLPRLISKLHNNTSEWSLKDYEDGLCLEVLIKCLFKPYCRIDFPLQTRFD